MTDHKKEFEPLYTETAKTEEAFQNKRPQKKKIDIQTSMDIKDGQFFQLVPESLMALQEIAKNFKRDRIYGEKEVNEILKAIDDDYVTLRRYLIEHGYLNRKPDGSQYWLADKNTGKG